MLYDDGMSSRLPFTPYHGAGQRPAEKSATTRIDDCWLLAGAIPSTAGWMGVVAVIMDNHLHLSCLARPGPTGGCRIFLGYALWVGRRRQALGHLPGTLLAEMIEMVTTN